MSGKSIADFEVPSTGHQRFASTAFRGHPYIIYFYPKDATPGCTLEATQFRDLHKEFRQARVMVFGVSRDSVASHEKFKASMQLPFDLLTDEDEKLCKLFEVIKEKNMHGKKVMGIQRCTFLMGPRNEILQEWRDVKVDGHAAAVLLAAQSVTKSVS